MPNKNISESPLSKILFVKKMILLGAKTFSELYKLSRVNLCFKESVWNYLESSDLSDLFLEDTKLFLIQETSNLLNACCDSQAERDYINHLEFYMHLYRRSEARDQYFDSFMNYLKDRKIINKAVNKGFINMAQSILEAYNQMGLRATYAELGEEGYQLLHPPASSQPTMRFFDSNRLAHDSSGVGELIIFSEINEKEARAFKSDCRIQ